MRTAARALLMSLLLAFSFNHSAEAEGDPHASEPEELSHTLGSTTITISHPNDETATDEMISVSFNEDVRIDGNELPAGKYWVAMRQVAENDIHVAFNPVAEGADEAGEELLRLAVRPDKVRATNRLEVKVEPNPPVEEVYGEQEERRLKKPSAQVYLLSGGLRATLHLETTGARWESTPPPEMPEHIQEPWRIVLSSLNGLVEEDLAKHVANFDDDFVTDWDDGGSTEAYIQFLIRILDGGGLEGSVLRLDQVEWTEEGGSVQFRGIGVFMDWPYIPPDGRPTLKFTATDTSEG